MEFWNNFSLGDLIIIIILIFIAFIIFKNPKTNLEFYDSPQVIVQKVAKIYNDDYNSVNNVNISDKLNVGDKISISKTDNDLVKIKTNYKNQFVINKNGELSLINTQKDKPIYTFKKTGQFVQNDIGWSNFENATIAPGYKQLGESVRTINLTSCQNLCADNPYCTHVDFNGSTCRLIGPTIPTDQSSNYGSLGLRQTDGGFKRIPGGQLISDNATGIPITSGIDGCEAACAIDPDCIYYHYWVDQKCSLGKPIANESTGGHTLSQKSFIS